MAQPIDEQLAALAQRHADLLDELTRIIEQILSGYHRADVLLDRKLAEAR